MVRIPQYQSRVKATTPQIQTQVIPSANRAAFGESVYKAQEDSAEMMGKVVDLFKKRYDEKVKVENDIFDAQIESGYLQHLHNALFSEEPKTVTRDGKQVQISTGTLNRLGINAKDSTNDMDDWQAEYLPKFLGQVRDPERKMKMYERLNRHYQNGRNDVIRHEIQQDRAYKKTEVESYLETQAQTAQRATTREELTPIIKSMNESSDSIMQYMGEPENALLLKRQENTRQALESSINGLLVSGQYDKAVKLIEEFKGELSPEGAKSLSKLVKESKELAKNQLKNNQITSELGIFEELMSGKKTVEDIDIGKLAASGAIRREGAEALTTFKERSDELITSDDDEVFLSTINSALAGGTPEELNKFARELLTESTNSEKGKKNMAILFKAAQDHAGNREIQLGARTTIKAAIDAGLDGGTVGRDYIEAINSGMKPAEAREKVLNAHQITPGQPKSALFGPSAQVPNAANQGGFFKRYVDMHTEFGKGVASMVASTPQALGALYKEYGEAPEENKGFWSDILSAGIGRPKVSKPAKDRLLAIGEKMIEDNRKWILDKGLTRPEAGALNQVAFDLGSGGGSLGLSVGMALITKNPIASAAMFGAMQKGRIYQEAREAGLSPKEASAKSTQAGAIEGGIELIGLSWLLKNHGGRIVNAAFKSFGNAAQEGAQSLGEDQIAEWRNKGGFEKLQDAAYNMGLGFFLGGSVSTILDIGQHQENIKELQKAGMTEEQAQNVIVKTAQGVAQEVGNISEDIDAELQRFESEGGATGAPAPKQPKIRKELQHLVVEAQKFETAEEFAASIVPSEKQVLARKFFMDLYGQVKGQESEGQPVDVSGKKISEPVEGGQGMDISPRVKKGQAITPEDHDTLISLVQKEIDSGSKVSLSVEGKTIPITSINRGMMQDEKGQRWGTLPVFAGGTKIFVDRSGKVVEPSLTTAPKRNVMPTGERKESKAYKRAVEFFERELKDQPGAKYTSINIADQMSRAFQFVEQNPTLARKVAFGIEPAPAGMRETAVSIAYNNKVLEQDNLEEFGRSYRSRSLRQSARGQEIVLEKGADVNINDPEHFMKQVLNARMAQAGKKIFDVKLKKDAPVRKAFERIRTEVSKVKGEVVNQKNLDISEAQKIIDSLVC